MEKIALIGSGLIGTGWGIVFSESGRHPVLFDTDRNATDKALIDMIEGIFSYHFCSQARSNRWKDSIVLLP